MERRFVIFLVVTLLLWTGYIGLSIYLAPPPEEAVAENAEGDAAEAPEGDPAAEAKPQEKPAVEAVAADDPAAKRAPRKWLQLGSLDATKSAMLVTFDSRGGAVERVELSRYFDVSDTSGYLGHLSLTESDSGGGTINLVGPGTPAALAKPEDPSAGIGLKPGDVLQSVEGRELADVTELESFLSRETMPRQQIKLVVARQGFASPLTYTATLTRRPLAVVQPENHIYPTDDGGMQILPRDPLSLLVTFDTIGPRTAKPAMGEIPGLPPLYTSNWDLDEATDDHVQFSFTLGEPELKGIQQEGGSLKLVKRFSLPKPAATPDAPAKEYHVDLQIELHNQGSKERSLAYRMLGPTGLPLEGWWYSTKLHPDWGFKGAGARDVVWMNERGHRLLGNPMIVSEAKRLIADEKPPVVDLLYGDKAGALDYAGVDTQFFLSAILPQDKAADQPLKFRRAEGLPVQDVLEVPKNRLRTTDVSVLLVGEQAKLAGGEKLVDSYQVFFGPKDPRILKNYGLEQTVEMGFELFAFPARMLQGVLNFLYSIVRNYGLAIILLTVLVRSLMVPISLKQAKNAAMMQQLAPEVQKIKEKYPDDAMKQHAAVQELYKKHNFNMFSGCLPVFLQLPIFIGLYRCLSVDIDLRDAPLFPGIAWASNLAGPDKLFRWDSWMPSFIADEAGGWLGPYFNVFPLITVTLFLIQQKLFTPPATDEQTKMQQQMMTYMTVFMGVMFYKVPAGLCLYFITSSLWGICERKLLPKPKPLNPPDGAATGGAEKTDESQRLGEIDFVQNQSVEVKAETALEDFAADTRMLDLDDTIAAIASPPGGALRGIVRLSGPASITCAEQLFVPTSAVNISALRQAACLAGSLQLGERWGAIPARLYAWPSTQSYTRQPSVELHTIGSPPLLEAVLEAAVEAGARLARPGEFTLRAHLAGRLDLTQAEAVLGVIDARSQHELALALEQLSGGLAGPLTSLRSTLLDLLAHLEAGLDFADEDIEFISPRELDRQLQEAEIVIARLVEQMRSRHDAAELPRVVLWGEPNVGKSSLLNALAGSAVAIVSDRAGTTRDYVTKTLSLEGVPCLLVDTAGATPDWLEPVAAAAQQATQSSAAAADVTLLCLDASRQLSEWETTQLRKPTTRRSLVVLTKCDLPTARAAQPGEIATSSTSGAGLAELRVAVARQLHESRTESALVGTAVRCRESLQQAALALGRARDHSARGDGEELVAAELRLALDGLGQVAGVVYTDDVLDRVFSRFCIGK